MVTFFDYSTFGGLMNNRNLSSNEYRYGFQGQERDNEIKGDDNSINFEFRMHDPQYGRFLSIDPLTAKYPDMSPYCYAANRPVTAIDNGEEPIDPRTGRPVYMDLNMSTVYYFNYELKKSRLKAIVDEDLYSNANPIIFKRGRDAPDGAWDGGFSKRWDRSLELLDNKSILALQKIYPMKNLATEAEGYAPPNDAAWRNAAK